ncbi:MAG TPA: methyltransferase domain-containing protein [Stellaceae bacterium]|nr:methyltransferase domain-containing protein [Stellaceae bacterium]
MPLVDKFVACFTLIFAGLFLCQVLFRAYAPPGGRPEPAWLTALELPPAGFSYPVLVGVSVLGLFLEIMLIRWVSSEITIFAYFKNFVLVACFLGFGLGAHLCRQKINLLASFAPLAYLALLIKLPWPALRGLVAQLTGMLGSTTEVDIWGVPTLSWDMASIGGLAGTMVVVIPLFLLVSMIFIPLGQMTARLLEEAKDGILAYSANVAGGLIGILLYTCLCLFYQPPAVWFLVAGLLFALVLAHARRLAVTALGVFALCVGMASLPDSTGSVEELLPEFLTTAPGTTVWSPYQKLFWAPTLENGNTVAYQLMTNDSWYQYVVDLSNGFIASHPRLFSGIAPEWNPYNMPYRFYHDPPDVLVLGAGMGNDVAAALRNGAGHVTAVEIDPLILRLGAQLHPEQPYADKRVEIVNDDARSYMQNATARFDLITFSLLDSHTTSSHYSNIRIDNYVYTREAITAAKRLLKPGGVMVVKFQVGRPFIAGRLKSTLTDVFGSEPLQFSVDQAFNVSPGTFFVAGDAARIAAATATEDMARYLETHHEMKTEPAEITTDDWPFFYQHAPGLPSSVLLISFVLVAVSWLLLRRTAVPLRDIDWMFFALGAGFMLMESLIVSRMALLFGTTWLVNAITISGLLLVIVGANLLERAGLRLPTAAAFAGLFVAIVVAYLVPVSALFLDSFPARLAAGIVVECSPVFFASVVFIRTFSLARFSGNALGSNVMGSLVGGLLESLSMWVGLRALLIVAALLYLTAFVLSRRTRAA